MNSNTLAIDFGTSNSAAAVMTDQGVLRIPIEGGAETLPTAVFFPLGGGVMQIGTVASEALISGEEGRYMRALKSVLGLALLHETRGIGGRHRSTAEILSDFLAELRIRAEAATGQRFTHALSGRPVHFHSDDPAPDARAEDDLRACYLAAGFEAVSFLAEPEAAAIACQRMGGAETLGLIVDIGGGTSDFSVFRGAGEGLEIIVNHGVRLGGVDFDHAVSMAHAMPPLGLGGEMRRDMGKGLLPVPRAPFVELSTWAKIPFLYTAKMRRMADEMARLAVQPEKLERFRIVLTQELGHELAFAVERGKIDANTNAGEINMAFIEPGLAAPLSADALDAALVQSRAVLHRAAAETLEIAGVEPEAIGRVILVGGSSLMRFASDELCVLCPEAEILRSEAFTAVIDGLALAAGRGYVGRDS
jgi:hypothetical chaperone protein